jgi:uncharacterized protein VirK/YbjX
MKPKTKTIKAWAVIACNELKMWWTGKKPNEIWQYDVFFTKAGALQAKKEWGFPAKVVPCEIKINL